MQKYIANYKDNIKVALPVIISQAGQTLTNLVDTMMIGHYNTLSLSASAFVSSVFIIFLVFGIGFSSGLTPLVGKAYGENSYNNTGVLLQNSLLLNIIIGFLILITLNSSTPLLYHMGQATEVVDAGKNYFKIMSWSLLPIMVFFSFKQFGEGVQSTKPAMFITLGCNLLNIFLNYLFIYGNWGFEEMGLDGAGYATLIARILMAISMASYILGKAHFRKFIHTFFTSSINKKTLKEVLQISFPISLQYIMEVAAFGIGSILVGNVGKTEIAAHQIVIGIVSTTFMMSSGLAAAITIRTSNELGKNNIQKVRTITWSGLHIVIAFMIITSIVFILGKDFFPSLHTNDMEVIRIAAPLMVIAGLFQLFDGTQVVSFGGLRGISDVKIPTFIAFIAYWVISLPIGYILTFPLGFREAGIWYGFLCGLGTSSILLTLRFNYVTKKLLKRSSADSL